MQLIDASQKILDLIASGETSWPLRWARGVRRSSSCRAIVETHRDELDRILTTLHPTLDIVAAHQDQLDNALAWLGPAFYGQGLAASHGPWLDIFIRSLGASPNAVLCDLFDPTSTVDVCTG